MRAFKKNIDALENKIELFIQKWKNEQEENIELKKRNKELEETLKLRESIKEKKNESSHYEEELTLDEKYASIEADLEKCIVKIDYCLEQINIELNGKG